MKPAILALLVVLYFQLTTTKGFVDCRTSCRKCREGFEEVSILEIYCSMCKECRDRRRERMAHQRMPSKSPSPPEQRAPPSFKTRIFYRNPPRVGRMDTQMVETRGKASWRNREAAFAKKLMVSELKMLKKEQRHRSSPKMAAIYVPSRRPRTWKRRKPPTPTKPFLRQEYDEGYLATWPENCPTPPVCSSEEIVKLTKPKTTTTTTTTTASPTTTTTTFTSPPPTCPPVTTCRKKTPPPPPPAPSCVPCQPTCLAPCPPPGPIVPSEIYFNINWNGKVPSIKKDTSSDETERLKLKKRKSTPTTSDDWLEPTTGPTTAKTTTTMPTTTTTTMSIPLIPQTPPMTYPPIVIPATYPPQLIQDLSCFGLPLAFQGQIGVLGNSIFNGCNKKFQITTTNQPKILLDEQLIRKILINANQENNGGNNAFINVNQGNEYKNILEETNHKIHGHTVSNLNVNMNGNINNNEFVSGGPTYSKGNVIGGSNRIISSSSNFNAKTNGGSNINGNIGNLNNNGAVHYEYINNGANNEGGSNHNKLKYSSNNNLQHFASSYHYIASKFEGNPNNEGAGNNVNINNNANFNVNQLNNAYNTNKKGGPSNTEYDFYQNHQFNENERHNIKNTDMKQKFVINENPFNDKTLHRKIVMNENPYNIEDVHRKIYMNKQRIKDSTEREGDVHRPMSINKEDKEKHVGHSKDQDYFYVYVGLPTNVVRSRQKRSVAPTGNSANGIIE